MATSKKRKLQVGSAVIALSLGYLLVQGAHNFSNYFLTVKQYEDHIRRFSEQTVRVQGTLQSTSVSYNPKTSTLRFDLVSNGAKLPILYQGPMPTEQFKNASAIVKGHMEPDGIFKAQKLEIQCPDHYSAAPTARNP
ncbi:cytochrome c maturation protein CcmE [Sulfobacillus thermosulfidooxidans]|uniref:Cytochrome c-type biogenesis protein CcmE n=1 Tax=Sulfobacillus thermosulfidooxidans (strain DSM 9293 / VKM B-1269 / AT-1) TaxID=929705 RepID=A0A1W1WI95_SULTA|nr:cytochrome c maturation protein CcmE [Sulfobacillus thermosulfidooxidans]OLZ10724.1 cytochrome C biogenesis protein CcmE [Sulfobacillus thermosulfidooxidans]OLZ13237.1 cytochrome C biogenesis protein CcmE [Sulfobacillus thermosulfidooxidans]OLZ21617.1 cytochrome C biogenesis protein CcmE [Sulfobacillus thermosulfidooxidans]SMC05975.1 cytochrome c-type biogenesis protein CcmE [Sulfobacillus thermosulfidooxidans DSM 9293]